MSEAQAQIVITGAGLVTPLGLSREATWAGVRAGRCGLGPLSAMEQALPAGSTGGQAPDLPADFEPTLPREVRYLRWALLEALDHAGVRASDPLYASERCGFMLGTTLHGMRAGGQFLRSNDPALLVDFLAGGTLRDAARPVGFTGFAATTCSACSSSLGSIALAASLLRSGQLDLVVAGGYDTISEYVYGGFNSLRLVAPGPLRPFARGRQGMKLAEGYGVVVLERADDARRRGVPALATILGYGESADAHHLTQPQPEGEGAARAMRAALTSAGVHTTDIDLIAAHATGTPDNDAGEHAALRRVFGDDLPRVPVVAFKSHLGHTLGGAGAVELILSALALRDQVIPGCASISAEEVEFPNLRVPIGPATPAPLRATLNTSLGFGGANTCVIMAPAPQTLAAPHEPATTSPPLTFHISRFTPHVSRLTSDVLITGIGVVLPGAVGNDAFVRAMTDPSARRITHDTGAVAEADYLHLLNARRVRRMSDYVKVSLAATMLACRDAGIDDLLAFAATCGALLGSTHGSANYSEQYYRQIVQEGFAAANPLLFAEGVPNAAAAHLSLMLSLKGPCQTVIGTRTAGLDALHLAATRIAAGEWDRAVVGAAEEYAPIVNAAYRQWGLYAGAEAGEPFARRGRGFAVGGGAVTLVLESAASLAARGGVARGRIVGSTGPVPVWPGDRRCGASVRSLLADVHHVISSANGTWIDRLEAGLLRRAVNCPHVQTLCGRVAETFSVMPLAGIAWALSRSGAAVQDDLREVGVLCTDYTGLASAAVIKTEGK